MKYKEILIFLLFLGIIFVIVDIIKATYKCKKEKVIYRFLPRTFEEEMENPVSVTDMFATMFSQPSPWIGSIGTYKKKKQESVNKYFISQV
jgi:hypothetical protein